MNKIDVEQLPTLVAAGCLSRKEAANIIWEDIYCCPPKYGLGLLDEDDKSDFLLFLQNKFEQMFDDYEPGKARFRTYIHGLLRVMYINWVRRRITVATEEHITQHTLRQQYNIDHENYETEAYDDAEDLAIFKKTFAAKKHRTIAENTALVLTLKNCHNIDETILKNVSKFINVDTEVLRALVEKLKNKSSYKLHQREQIIRRRDNAFYYHRKYLLELHKLQEGTTSFEKVQKKYQAQTETWIRQNKLLSHRFVLSPSNESIGNEIGMEARKVSFYISHAVRKRNPFVSEDEDDIRDEADDEKADDRTQ